MRDQYLAQVRNGYCKEGEWWNAKTMQSFENGRYCKTLEEAQMWIDKAVQKGIKTSQHGSTIGNPPFSIYNEPSEKDLIIETRIKKRQVTEWEEV